jgi:hypothetical protein
MHRPHTLQACKWTATASKNITSLAIRDQQEPLAKPTRPQLQSLVGGYASVEGVGL